MNPLSQLTKKNRRTRLKKLIKMRDLRAKAISGGPPEKIRAQKAKGKLTARERIEYLLDHDTFEEMGLLAECQATDFGLQQRKVPGDGVITGVGKIRGRQVALFAQDFTVLGGSLGLEHARKICRLMDMAYKARLPVIGLLDSGGARIQEGVASLDGYAEIFYRNVKSSGVIPQISVVLGPCAGGAVYSPALTDFVFMVDGISHMFVTGPNVVREATGEMIDFDSLGGSRAHAAKSGVCHFVAKSEPDCFRQVKELLSYLPSSRYERPPVAPTSDPIGRQTPLLETLCEIDPRRPYRMHHGIWQISDEHKFFEVHDNYAKNIVVGFMRLGGETTGVVANNPAHMAGALDIDASEKAARFIRFCNNFNIPILTLVDVPGYWPGVTQEHGGIIRNGAKLLYAYSEATVPKVTVIFRKAYGGAYIAMSSKHMGGDYNFALPSAEIAVMGPKGAVEILYSRDINAAENKGELKEKLSTEYSERFASPYQTAAKGSVDDVIEPKNIRAKIISAFSHLRNKHIPGSQPVTGNIPL